MSDVKRNTNWSNCCVQSVGQSAYYSVHFAVRQLLRLVQSLSSQPVRSPLISVSHLIISAAREYECGEDEKGFLQRSI